MANYRNPTTALQLGHKIFIHTLHLDLRLICFVPLDQIYLVTLTYGQSTQASFLQKNQMLQNVFLIFVTLSNTLSPNIRRHFRNKTCSILKLSKNVFNKKCGPKRHRAISALRISKQHLQHLIFL